MKLRSHGQWHPRKHLINNYLKNLTRLTSRAHVDSFTLHDLRRSCITNWARNCPYKRSSIRPAVRASRRHASFTFLSKPMIWSTPASSEPALGLFDEIWLSHQFLLSVGLKIIRENAPGRIRTCDRRIRNPVLYPAELRAHKSLRLLNHKQL